MSKKLKVGVIGCGEIARWAHLKGYTSIPEECEVVALCDIKPEATAKVQKEFGLDGAKIYNDHLEMLKDKEIDAISVATPNKFHMEHTINSLKAGKHVICEKPLAMNAAEAKQMCRAAKDADKILQVGFQMRFLGQTQFLQQFINSGNMGDIYYARAKAIRRRGVPHWGVFIDKEKQGGGPLIDIGVHILDLTLSLMGNPKPVCATGKTWDLLAKNPQNQNFWGDFDRSKFTVEDFAVGMIRFDNGAVVTLESSFMANAEDDPFETQLFGTKAGATIRGLVDDTLNIYKEIDGQYFELKPQHIPKVDSAHVAEVQAFVRAVSAGEKSPVPGENGLTLNAIFDALYKSSETGHEELVDVSF